MIFVTVGTHEQSFNRLIIKIDDLIEKHIIDEEVIIQVGYSTYNPKYAKFVPFINYSKMEELIKKARIVITHGGPASFMNVISMGKKPIVVPRQLKFKEHINDHQVDFTNKVLLNGYPIYRVMNIEDLEWIIKDYDDMDNYNIHSNNEYFVSELAKIIKDMF